MRHALKPRRIELDAQAHLRLDPDPDAPHRYLVRFCGLDRDRSAQAATERARVRLMLASLHGRTAYPYPLPGRVVIGSLDSDGWHSGGSAYARALAAMPAVSSAIDRLEEDLLLRVALAAARDRDAPGRGVD